MKMQVVKNILIVDDDEDILNLLEISLSNPKFNVDKARNGEEALQKSREKKYDLVLLDLMMPKMDGVETCRIMNKHSDTPIFILSAKQEKESRTESLNVSGYITKPFDPGELFARISKHFQN